MLFNRFLTSAVALLSMIGLVGIGAPGLVADGKGERCGYEPGYRPPGIGPFLVNDEDFTIRLGELALDANGGRNNPYFRQSDPTNINHQWELRAIGEYYMILPRVGASDLALDANGGRGNPYFRKPDASNINHLWKFIRFDACYLIVPKLGEGELALNANGGRNNPYLSEFDAADNNCLWELHKTGEHYMIVPLVKAETASDREQEEKLDLPREIEKILKRAEAAGGDKQETLDAIEKIVREIKEKAKDN